ncbi:solute carrier family 39 (zinc transporter), member 1/2/3 [Angomonas deanei]|uniref:ZIP Zinc transporter, putative n=1 Tax=Angomonas deanei TaxID=59799 RepID=A0A7G2C2I4_9TRYP|nr:solute carrier family 39 (zinc transporter), member 1/2/3 [Angomonas deanei]CAD2213866.1 ZIP Zinc transporter, putative [Angomonas deanei]|eukprot:EPY25454.1 solute carrier family 39 (zinc transporter), member 1/2/3 [Angomonas deanei]
MLGLDLELAAISERWMKANRQQAAAAAAEEQQQQPLEAIPEKSAVTEVVGGEVEPCENTECPHLKEDCPHTEGCPHTHWHDSTDDCEASHGHSHADIRPPMDMGQVKRVISAVCMEFGVTLHSVFVGLAVGLTTNKELKPLMVALFFHQLFEGMSLGSRLVDAKFADCLQVLLAVVFAVSAPVGIAIATIAVAASPDHMAGTAFVTTLAVLNSLCGGILLYLAFSLLLHDFVSDMNRYGNGEGKGCLRRKCILYFALWFGMGLMALGGEVASKKN